MVYHVAKSGSDMNPGTEQQPFLTINRAAQVLCAGDTAIVHAGIYREWVNPVNGGLNDTLRITYRAAENEHVEIRGSEPVKNWEKLDNGLWKAVIDNAVFGAFNPFKEEVNGDWMILPDDWKPHLGDVYINDISLFEARTLEDCIKAEKREFGYQIPGKKPERIIPAENTIYQWYAETGIESTTLYCNFQKLDPNAETVEINVRKCCFYPEKQGVNYITLSGFEISRAATPFSPPTADQPGIVGVHWSKGWIIENNDIHDAKCSAVSLGRDGTDGHNLYSRFGRKPGYQYQMEAVFLGLERGWNREKVGSHIVRNNHIHHCGQNAIVGHMGCAFSKILHNEIDHIAVKHEFFGWEIAGIKFHAAVDAIIENNCIHHCTLGTWLDWQAQGTRVTRNVYYDNWRDIMVEVSHGPCLMDNNIFASDFNFENMAQGTAMVNNIFCGITIRDKVLDRATPYHFPHTTSVAGCAVVYGGDDRFMNNIYACHHDNPHRRGFYGLEGYNEFTSPEEYPVLLEKEGNTDEAKFYRVNQPVYASGNLYSGYAKPFRTEKGCVQGEDVTAEVYKNSEGSVCIKLNASAPATAFAPVPVTTASLGFPRITEELYENPDGTPVNFKRDFFGNMRDENAPCGPFAKLTAGETEMIIWKKQEN